jgi:hypothetical protein
MRCAETLLMRVLRWFAWSYAVIVAATFVFAMVSAVAMRNLEHDHMLPVFILGIVCAPLDLLVFVVADRSSGVGAFLDELGLGQLVVIALCGGVQAWFLLWIFRPAAASDG